MPRDDVFPAWRYSPTEGAKIVTEAEAALLGPGWYLTPADFPATVDYTPPADEPVEQVAPVKRGPGRPKKVK